MGMATAITAIPNSQIGITFSDVLSAVRCSLWRSRLDLQPAANLDLALSLDAEREQLIHLLAF
jgi:hypothetical protein